MAPREGIDGQLEAIAGVASAEVTFRGDQAPVARVWLDGTEPAEEVRAKVNALLGSSVPVHLPGRQPGRRGGLGKNLAQVISEEDASGPSHLVDAGSVPSSKGIRRVAVVESESGVSVEVEDGKGNRFTQDLGDDGSIDLAVVTAVTSLLACGHVDVVLQDVETPDGAAVLASVRAAESRTLGAAHVEYGRPWAVASAVVHALELL